MKSLGIIGSDNSHSSSIAKVCNLGKKVPLRVTHIWGESEESAKKAAAAGSIPHIEKDWRSLEGKVDAVMIDHRHGKDHYEPAKFFIERGVPTFIDKPLTVDLAQAVELLSLAEEKNTPVCTFGLVPLQSRFRKFATKLKNMGPIKALNTSGPVSIDSPNGGIFFYGFHQVDAIVELMGTEVESVLLQRHGENGVGTIFFSGGRIATLNCLEGEAVFHWRACTEKAALSLPHQYDKEVYLPSTRVLYKLAQKGEVPWSKSRMLAPIAILQALDKSLRSGQVEKVARV